VRSLRHPFGGKHRYLRAPRGAYDRPKRPKRRHQFHMHPRRRVEVTTALASPEERSSRPNLRLHLVGLLVLCLFAVLGLRLWTLQVINQKSYAAAVTGNALRITTIPPPRGQIVDRNDTVLVGNATQQEIVLSRAEAAQHPVSIGQVAALVGVTPKTVRAALNDPQYSPYEPVPVLQNAPAATVQYLEAHQSAYPGVSVQSVTARSYPSYAGIPSGQLGTHVLGYVSPITGAELKALPNQGYTQSSQIGQSGLEAQYEPYLRGVAGRQALEVNAQGNVVGVASSKRPVQGDTLVTHIDAGLQAYVQQALQADILADRATPDPATGQLPLATNGAAVVLDAQTGAVLAMASFPNYDLNEWVGGISQAQYQALNAPCQTGGPNAACPLNNNAIQGLYTPGSTFKLITATAALQDGLITPTTQINDPGFFTIPGCTSGCTFHDADNGSQGPITIPTAITVSSDVFFYNLGVDFWEQRNVFGLDPIQNMAAEYSLGEKTGIDLPNEVAGQVDSPQLDARLHQLYPKAYPYGNNWTAGNNLELAFGQGGTVITPIEQAVAFATFANGGTRYAPQVGAAVVSPQGKLVKAFPPKVVGHVTYSPANYAAMLQGFEGVINQNGGTAYGTFQQYASPQALAMNLAGKTGTADVNTGEPNAWFVSFGPNPNPKYVVVAVVSQAGYGASAAAPAVASIWNYLATNPVGPLQLPSATKQPSTTLKPINPPAVPNASTTTTVPGTTTTTTAPGTPAPAPATPAPAPAPSTTTTTTAAKTRTSG
jgi:penicillin-binding protein 2